MKPFTLDTVLSYRERLEDFAKNKLAAARRSAEETGSALDIQKKEYQKTIQLIDDMQQQGVEINALIFQEGRLTFLKNKISGLEEELLEKKKEVEKARNQLLLKSRDRQVMEKLKERQDEAWKQHINKKEASFLDEIAITFHDKK